MPTKDQVLALYQLSGDYRQVGRALGIPPGLAYMIATGLPADGGDTHHPGELDRPGVLEGSTQHLAYQDVVVENPSAKGHVHEWIMAMVGSDRQMQRAAQGRDAAPGEVKEPEEHDIGTVLTRDHDQVMALMKQLKTIPGVSDGGSPAHLSRRKSIVDMVAIALSKHEAAEQEEFWPAVRRLFPGGGNVVELALSQEQEGKELLHALGECAPSEARFDELVVELDKASRRHVALEDQVLATMRQTVPEDELRRLGAELRRARAHAPTRPHPHAPKEPAAAAKAGGAAVAVADKVRDTVGERPAERRGKAVSDLEAKKAGAPMMPNSKTAQEKR